MKKEGILFLIIITMLSCGKTPVEEQDSILYKTFDPTVTIATVESFYLEDHVVCTADIPVPEDSSVTYSIDINDDLINDFIFDISHNRWEETQYCGHCSIFEYQITISGVNENNFVSNNPVYSWEPRWYYLNDTISSNRSWHKEIFVSLQGGCQRPFVDLKDAYIGIKHDNNYGWIHISPLDNNGIEIKELAINQTDNRLIKAGQKQ